MGKLHPPLVKPSCAFVRESLWSSIGSCIIHFPPPQAVPFTADVPTQNTLLSHKPSTTCQETWVECFINSIINFGTAASSHRKARIFLPPDPNRVTKDVKPSAVRRRAMLPALHHWVNRCCSIYLDKTNPSWKEDYVASTRAVQNCASLLQDRSWTSPLSFLPHSTEQRSHISRWGCCTPRLPAGLCRVLPAQQRFCRPAWHSHQQGTPVTPCQEGAFLWIEGCYFLDLLHLKSPARSEL